MRKLLARTLKVLGVLFVLSFVGFCGLVNLGNLPSKGERDRHARAGAEQLVEALDAYYSDQRAYPPELDRLAPRYLATIPESWGDRPFEYAQSTGGQDFSLGYVDAPMGTLPNDGYHSYEASIGHWQFEVR
ncbi:MAG: hypothetical protein JRG94_01440 [Deltaproteobacteria bacterium]|nr:hypothetical protein [Deltaproteobacteria bacterium]